MARERERYGPLRQDKVSRLAGLSLPARCYFSIHLSGPGLCSEEHLLSQVVIKYFISKRALTTKTGNGI